MRQSWNKGKTKETDPRIAAYAERVSGPNHHRFGKRLPKEHIDNLCKAQRARPLSSYNTSGFSQGRDYFRGKTKENDASVARRAKILSEKYKGKPNPAHSARMTEYYERHPEQHPNRILSAKGHETGIERKMREALIGIDIVFEAQYRIGRYFVDFAIPAKMIAIEVDGAYWHKDVEREQRRETEIATIGWRILRFSEDDVNKRLSHCLNQLLSALNSPLLT